MKIKVLYILLGIVGACLLIESALRITDNTDYNRFSNDPTTGLITYRGNYSFVNAQSCYSTTVVTNNEGLHAPEPPSTAKKSNEFRIIVAGSSFAEGLQVPLDKIASADLERLLNALPHKTYTYEVIPVAFSGNGTFLDILYYLRYGEPLQPNLVVDITTEYEHEHDAPSVSHFDAQGNLVATLPAVSKNPQVVLLKSIFRQSKLVMNLFNRLLILKNNGLNAAANTSASDPDYQAKQWSHEEQLLGAFANLTAKDSAPLVVASWATPYAGATTTNDMHEHIEHAAAEDNFYYDDMLPFVSNKEAQTGVGASWTCDAHWSGAGDEYVAEAIFSYLQAHPTLIGR